MTLFELKQLLRLHGDRGFRFLLPGGGTVPESFHVTEVGRLDKTFIDCGGTLRENRVCQLQVWIGPDHDHRLEAGKMAAILEKAKTFLSDESIPVEIEYEEEVISQYTINGHEIVDDAVILSLAPKHTECLAPELCGLPAIKRLPGIGASKSNRCGPAGCC